MVSRGVPQLKNIRLYLCDFGGSSKGVRNTLQSQELVQFMDKNKHLDLEVTVRRNRHPYFSATYINGYVKDQPLKNMNEEEVMHYFDKVTMDFGRRAIKHSSNKTSQKERTSIQGQWNETMWNSYPKHLLEKQDYIPETLIHRVPDRPFMHKKKQTHRHTQLARWVPKIHPGEM